MAKAKASKAKTAKATTKAVSTVKAKPKKETAKKVAPKAVPKKEISKVAAKIAKPTLEAVPAKMIAKNFPEPSEMAEDVSGSLEKSPASVKPVKEPKVKKEPKPKKEKSAKKIAAEKAIADENKKWADYKEKYGSEKATNYSMSGVFEPHQPLQHKVLGWGYIVSIQNDRLEVLFEQGTKMLISNYKTNS